MKLGNLVGLIMMAVGSIGVLYGISLNDNSSFGVIAIVGACTFPIALAFFHKTRNPILGKDWLQKEINLGGSIES